MSAVAQISPVAVVAPVYQIERTTDLSMAQFLDQIKSLLSNDFFAPVVALRILKNQDDFSKLLAKHRFK